MKGGRSIDLVVFLLGLCMASVSWAANPAEESYTHGVAYAAQGAWLQAKEAFHQALQSDPFFSPAEEGLQVLADLTGQTIQHETAVHLLTARVYAQKRMLDAALAEVAQALTRNPEYPLAYHRRGTLYALQGQHD